MRYSLLILPLLVAFFATTPQASVINGPEAVKVIQSGADRYPEGISENSSYSDRVTEMESSNPEGGYQTENIVIVVIDGVRNTEAFEDPTHQYIPHLWNDLRPLGTMYTNYYCTGMPSTTSGQLTMGSGRMQGCRATRYFLSEEPMFFEHYREQLNVPQDDTWVFMNYDYRDYEGDIYASENPALGEDYGARAYWGYDISDEELAAAVDSVMDNEHPSVTTVWFKDVDTKAHRSGWDDYVNAIRIADELVYNIWLDINSDPFYKGRTTLIVTTDHGRHDDEHGGIISHGCFCHDCRHLFFLAIGPDIKTDEVIENHANRTDLAPTIAELLGFDMPMADGRVLYEMLTAEGGRQSDQTEDGLRTAWADGATRLTASQAISRDPAVVGFDDTFHVAWIERDPNLSRDSWDVWYTSTEDHSDQTLVFSDSTGDRTPMWVSIDADEQTGVYVSFDYHRVYVETPGADSTFGWGIGGVNKVGFDTWSDIEEVVPAEFTIFPKGHSLAMQDGAGSLIAQESNGWHVVLADRREPAGDWLWTTRSSPNVNRLVYEYPQIAVSSDIRHIAWISFERAAGGIFKLQPNYLRYVSPDDQGVVDLGPYTSDSKRHLNLKSDGDLVIACWSQWDTDHWVVKWQRSEDGGINWLDQPLTLASSAEGAWRPDVAVLGNTVCVVWEDYRDGNAEIYMKISSDGGVTWSGDKRLTDQPNYSIRPRVALLSDRAYVVWQDLRDGNWEIYGKQI